MTKTCTKCREEKPIEEFGVLRRARDGRQPRCKPCHSRAVCESQRRHPQRVRRTQAQHRQRDPEGYRAKKRQQAYRRREAQAFERAVERDNRLTPAESRV